MFLPSKVASVSQIGPQFEKMTFEKVPLQGFFPGLVNATVTGFAHCDAKRVTKRTIQHELRHELVMNGYKQWQNGIFMTFSWQINIFTAFLWQKWHFHDIFIIFLWQKWHFYDIFTVFS